MMDVFYDELASILDADTVAPDDELRDFENWDSLTVLSICAMVDSRFNVNVSADDLAQSRSARDLATLVARRMPAQNA